jgi:simple sugar transport system permease protein
MPQYLLGIIILATWRAPYVAFGTDFWCQGQNQPMVATPSDGGRRESPSSLRAANHDYLYTPYFWFGNGFILGLPVSIYIVAAVVLFAWVGVRKTSIGLFVEAVGINSRSTYYSGISEKNIKLLAYTFCGFCSAIAGLILSSYVHSADGNNNGLNYELDAILAVVMGGTLMGTGGRFSLLASIIGALVIWTFTLSMYTLGVPANALLAGRRCLFCS